MLGNTEMKKKMWFFVLKLFTVSVEREKGVGVREGGNEFSLKTSLKEEYQLLAR